MHHRTSFVGSKTGASGSSRTGNSRSTHHIGLLATDLHTCWKYKVIFYMILRGRLPRQNLFISIVHNSCNTIYQVWSYALSYHIYNASYTNHCINQFTTTIAVLLQALFTQYARPTLHGVANSTQPNPSTLSEVAASLVRRILVLDIERPCLLARVKVRHTYKLVLGCHL
jgi:hypothetical protein